MTIWDLLRPWRIAKALDIAETALAHSRKHVHQQDTELLQTKRAGYDDIAKSLGCSVDDLMDGKIEPMLHEDPQKVYRALDNATASEVKFRLVKVVNRELRLVIRNMIDTLADCTLTPQAISDMAQAEAYATPMVMEDKRKVLGQRGSKTLHLDYAKDTGERDDGAAQAQEDERTKSAAK